MKLTFAASLVILVSLSLLAWKLQPPSAPLGKHLLVWVSDDNPLRQAQANLFNKEYTHEDARLDPANGGLDKVIVQSIAGVGPDVFDCNDAFELSAYVRSGIALDLSDDLRRTGIHVLKDAFRGTRAPAIYEGRVYGVPTNIAADGVWFHKDVFRSEGIPFPTGLWTWPKFIRLAQRMTKRDAQGNVLRFGFLFDWYNWRHFLRGFGAHVFSRDGTRCEIDSPEAVAAIQLMQDLVYKYNVSPSPSEEAAMTSQGGWNAGTMTYFAAKRAAMALGGRWWLATLRTYPNLQLGVVESPFETDHVYRGYGRATLVNRYSRNLKGALRFVEYLASASYNRLVNQQADGICAFKKYAAGAAFFHDPRHPREASNAIWLDIAKHAVPDRTSPYVDGDVVNRIMQLQMDLVQMGQKTATVALHDADRSIDRAMIENLNQDPSLKSRYQAATGKSGP